MPALGRSDRRHLFALFTLIASIYFATFTGVTSSNDGSHYALVRAIVSTGGFEISPFLAFTEDQDFATGPGGRYSDRPPGTALWAAPFYAAARLLPTPLVDPPSKHDRGNPRLLGVAAATALAGAAAVATFWLLLRWHFELGLFASDLAALALGLGTATWKYGSVLYSHSLSALLVLSSTLLLFRVTRCPSPGRAALLGLLVGASVVVEYSNALFALLATAYAAMAMLTSGRFRAYLPSAVAAGVATALPLAFLAYYDRTSFGCITCVSAFQVDTIRWPNASGMPSAFATPLGEGLVGMLLWGHDNQGIFLLSPIAWLALPGLTRLFKDRPREGTFVVGTFLIFLCVFAKSTNFNPLTNDGRYLVPFLGLWLVPLAFWVDRGYLALRGDGARLAGSLALFGLLWLSVRNAFVHVAFSWNYDLKYGDLLNMSTPLPNITRLLAVVFPNAANLWWLWLPLLPAMTVAWLALDRAAVAPAEPIRSRDAARALAR